MPIITDKIELQTNCSNPTLWLSNVEKIGSDAFSCQLWVHSGPFTCETSFCFDTYSLVEAIASFQHMIDGSPGEATIRYRHEPGFIRFKMNQLGHVIVNGELFDLGLPQQMLKFAFQTDQTVLAPLVRDLSSIRNG